MKTVSNFVKQKMHFLNRKLSKRFDISEKKRFSMREYRFLMLISQLIL